MPGLFDPSGTDDARTYIAKIIAVRQGQPRFREALLGAYGGRYAISRCDVAEVLEAAHVLPYRGKQTNHVQNGILLRGDLHTLFDLGLIAVETRRFSLVLSPL